MIDAFKIEIRSLKSIVLDEFLIYISIFIVIMSAAFFIDDVGISFFFIASAFAFNEYTRSLGVSFESTPILFSSKILLFIFIFTCVYFF